MLKGKKPSAVEKRLKALFYGKAGVGKTTCSIQFPSPYLIDTEKGAENSQYAEILEQQDGAVFQTTDFDELVTEVKALLTEKHHFKTLVIDPLTTIYDSLLDKSALKVGTEFGRHYGEANKQMKRLLNLLLRLDMNVIVTSHAKNEYGTNLSVLGQTFDCYKKLDYLFDLVIEIDKRGLDRVGIVKKSRIKTFAELEEFPFSYEVMADKYGKDIINKEVEAQELATPEQVAELKHLVEIFKVPSEVVDKWLDKAQATELSEMPINAIAKCIDHLSEKMKKPEVASNES